MLEISYILLTFIMASLIVFGYRYGAKKSNLPEDIQKKKVRNLILMLVGWFIYLGVLSTTKFLHDTSLPPRFVIFLFIPLIFISIRFFTKKKDSAIIIAFSNRTLFK